ncbi:MAG: TetR/AcrR family transcriptional regulator [Desulfobacterales bacterium]
MTENKLAALKQQERDARRRLILEAARDLFAEKDFRNVTVREIARAAGISIGTIYNYYENLTELFLDVFLKSADDLLARMDRAAAGAGHPLNELCRLYIDFLHENMAFYQMMGHFMLGGDLSETGTEKLNQKMRALMDRIEAAVKAADRRSDSRMIAHALFSALNGIMITYARYPGRDADDISRHTRRLAELIGDVFKTYAEV